MNQEIQRSRQQLSDFKQQADQRLEALAQQWLKDCIAPDSTVSPTPADLIKSVTDLTLRGGKRVRPALAYYAALCFEHGLDQEVLLDASLSTELLQTYLLIHDDVMDDDPERRGGPSVHVIFSEQTKDKALGRSLAILSGDLGCAMAQELLVRIKLPHDRALAALAEFVRMQWEVIQGQHLDVMGGMAPSFIHDAKTASYTTRGPVRLGAALAGATKKQTDQLEAYANPLGRAFQVRDDLLGVFGKKSSLGKPVGADLRAGKRTELVQMAQIQANASQKATLDQVVGNQEATDEQIYEACSIIEETGARKHSETLIDTLTSEALKMLEQGEFREEGTAFLRGIALLLAERDR